MAGSVSAGLGMGVLVRGALLAEVAGGLFAERGVLGSQAGDLWRAASRRARSDSAVARWAAARVVADRMVRSVGG